MASTDKSADPEVTTKEEAPPPPPPPPPAAPCFYHFAVDVALRALLFAAALTSVVVMVTSDQTVLVPVPNVPGVTVPLPAKFKYSPAFVYFVAALSVAGFYSIITILASISFFLKPACFRKFLVYFAFWDVLLLGVVASATGAAGAIGYTGLKGNKHVNWGEVCSTLDKFCQHVGSSTAVALFASVLLLLLSFLSIFSLHKRIRD